MTRSFSKTVSSPGVGELPHSLPVCTVRLALPRSACRYRRIFLPDFIGSGLNIKWLRDLRDSRFEPGQ